MTVFLLVGWLLVVGGSLKIAELLLAKADML